MKNNLNFDPFRFWVQFFVIVLFSVTSYSQVFQTLPLADTNFSRFEDIYFVNESTGFVLNYDNDLYKTTNKGILWTRSFVIGGTQGRCIGMFDANTGIMGADNYPYVLFKTFDGGSHWTDIQGSIPLSLPPTGVKAISIVNSTTAIACCPNLIIKTTNSGESWSVSYVTNSPFLLDCKFWSADSGFVAGSTLMFTSNGGITWKQVYQKQGAIFRNLQFVNRQLGFCTVDYSSQPYVIKTTNGGENWSVLNLPQGIVGSISGGIGFMNEQVGWIGGYHHMNPLPCYRTTNGGINWEPAGWGTNLRRFQFVNDSIIYAVGKAVYKFQADTFIDPMCIPQLLSPANGSFDMPLSFRLDWSDVLPSATYDVQISKTPAFTTTVFNRTGVGQSHSFIPVSEHNLILKPFTRYFWRARSNTSAGLSAWSVVWE
ncbi:MAG: hypothetical protein HOP31_13060, partial [Ignavibacteria bacterium]|nr:hypothetical protein [Ignavibacteria bacterium]